MPARDETPAGTRGRPHGRITPAWVAAAVAYAAIVGLLTLAPMPWADQVAQPPGGIVAPATWVDPVTWSSGSPRELMLNLMMFVPVGLLASRLGLVGGLLIPVALSLSIEIAQISMPDRVSDPRDLVANTLGGTLGALAMRVVAPERTPRPAARPAPLTREDPHV